MFTRRQALGATAVGAGVLGLGIATIERRARFRSGIPNPVLWTHEGRKVRFFDDLVKGKVVAINMMYAKCEGICPRMTTNLVQVQRELGDLLGRDVFMYSITLEPAQDTPEVLARYVERHPVQPRWPFLTGAPDDIEAIRKSLGFYDPDPDVDADKKQHTGMVRIGNERLDRWTMSPALGRPSLIAMAILHVRGVPVG